ncbi:hypothetical protein ALC53_11062 [Atta colombica]|uniref:Uncharacterized protein n=1 Tax=Atta colombica TaxID=520822 RepID=A0A195B288_9HYME|nr:hypothetical protein ALC53_11062 [Atta colombica]
MTADEMEMTDNNDDQCITVLFLTTFHDAREVALSISSLLFFFSVHAKRDERSANTTLIPRVTSEAFVCHTVIQQIVGSRSLKADTVSPSAAPPKLVLEFVPRKGHDNRRWALKFERYVPDSLNV